MGIRSTPFALRARLFWQIAISLQQKSRSVRTYQNMGYLNFSRPTRESLGLTPWVKYDKFNPHAEGATDARKSLSGLDYSPLRRITLASLYMGLLVSMGGFIFGYGKFPKKNPPI